MAKCDLSIQLDDPDRVYAGGGKVAGTVRVVVDSDVKCDGLEIRSVWRTHGRGNVDHGIIETVTAFSGKWSSGDSAEYRFELPIGQWPPSYHGHYLNVDHYIEAQAKIPWAFDAKASESFLMRPSCGPDGATASRGSGRNSAAGKVFLTVFLVIFAAVFFLTPVGWIAIPFFGLIGGTIWFFRSFLPKWALGEVTCRVDAEDVFPGDSVTGELILRPRKNIKINGITMQFKAREVCVSGSGSNRTTHTKVFYDDTQTLEPAKTLPAGGELKYPFTVAMPADAPYSMDLSDNDLIWSASLRVDIPRWPDWTREFKLRVVPKGTSDSAADPVQVAEAPIIRDAVAPTRSQQTEVASPIVRNEPSQLAHTDPPEPIPTSQNPAPAAEVTFGETAAFLWPIRHERDQVEGLVAAVTGLTFSISAFVERRLLYSGDDDPHVYPDGYAVWARFTDPPLPLVLYVPHDLADEFEQAGRDMWTGRGTVVGWDSQHDRLQIKLLAEPS